nr:hypothetical protein [Mycoplasma wenyonii]
MISSLNTFPLRPETIGRASNWNSLLADFFICLRNAPYTEAVFAYLSMELNKEAR